MKYIILVSREVWPSFNSLYAYTKLRGIYPREILILYSDPECASKLEEKIKILYRENDKNLSIRKMKIDGNLEDMRRVAEGVVEEGDVIDITGARKSMLLAFLDVRNVHIVYLLLMDMRFSSMPFMMRPLSLQKIMEVER